VHRGGSGRGQRVTVILNTTRSYEKEDTCHMSHEEEDTCHRDSESL